VGAGAAGAIGVGAGAVVLGAGALDPRAGLSVACGVVGCVGPAWSVVGVLRGLTVAAGAVELSWLCCWMVSMSPNIPNDEAAKAPAVTSRTFQIPRSRELSSS
jgi:hypothetical protein